MGFHPPLPSWTLVATVIFIEGQDAFSQGRAITENHYPKDNPIARNAWEDGWVTAARDTASK
jgi:hypothetical protein